MPARPGDRSPEAAAAQRLRHRRVRARAIQHDMRSPASRQCAVLIKVPHPAQIPLTLFAHIAQHHQRRRQFHPGAHESMNHGQHPHHPSRVIADARSFQAIVRKHCVERRVGGKHSIEMRRKQDHRPRALRG